MRHYEHIRITQEVTASYYCVSRSYAIACDSMSSYTAPILDVRQVWAVVELERCIRKATPASTKIPQTSALEPAFQKLLATVRYQFYQNAGWGLVIL